MPVENANFDRMQKLLAERRWEAFRKAVRQLDPADVADLVEDLPAEYRDIIFRILDPEVASDVVAELETPFVENLIGELPSPEIARLASHMAPDDAADLLGELDDQQSTEVLEAMQPDERGFVARLMRYGEDTAGGVMTTEVLSLPADATVADAERLLTENPYSDPFLYIYVTDPKSARLQGYVDIADLLHAEPDMPIERLLQTEYIYSTTDEDQQETARKFRRYDLWVVPVVDARHRLVGRITVDDIIDVLHEEADEDLAHLVGAPDLEEREDTLFGITRLRLPWLLITMFAGLVNSVIIHNMMQVTKVESLAIFVPAILAMGGNTGMQSSAICIRGIALDEGKYARLLGVVWREIRVGLCLGLVCGLITALTVFIILTFVSPEAASRPPARLALIVGMAMTSAMAFASSFGATVPIILHRVDIDPAVASGPFITTSNDLSATLIYFLICALLLGIS